MNLGLNASQTLDTNQAFDQVFLTLTNHQPFPWQRQLYERFMSNPADPVPEVCSIPTGLGKTSVMAVWLIALAHGAKLPRRLIYVVNRRTVVDQTTTEAEKLQAAVESGKLSGIRRLPISTLRGQKADNREWSADPSQPAIVVGTVDMIGSRLLFSGYGVGFKARPLHAGFLGQDALLVHDEAHLEPAFQRLVESIVAEQNRCGDFRPLRVMQMTATTRNATEANKATVTLTPDDHRHPVVHQRIQARKQLVLHEITEEKQSAEKIADLALEHRNSGGAVLIFVRTLDDVNKLLTRLKNKVRVQQLTGTMRGRERDELVNSDPVFMRFLPENNRNPNVRPAEGTVYLICTSAGEVGIDISADHMVCDLSTFESMTQRFGRVNRYGERTETRIDVVHPESFGRKDKKTGELKTDALDQARAKTLELLRCLEGDASPLALSRLDLDSSNRAKAFAPEPVIPPATDILFDAWSLTSITGSMPGRPPVEPYLHGIADWQPPETYVAWREEVERVTGHLLETYPPKELLEAYPLKPHELLRDRSDRVHDALVELAGRHPEERVWLVDSRNDIEVIALSDLKDKNRLERIHNRTVLLPPSVGGLTKSGILDGSAEKTDDVQYDVADIKQGPSRRVRLPSDDPEYDAKTRDMRLVCSIEWTTGEDEDDSSTSWDWYEQIPEGGGRTARKAVLWQTHVSDVVKRVERIIQALDLPPEIGQAVKVAAQLHDHGKRRASFQSVLGNADPKVLLAKSHRRAAAIIPEGFRHEFASLLDALEDEQFRQLDPPMQELALHLIAAHHGWARPHFDADQAFDPDHPVLQAEALAMETPRRFARLQRRYGRWGLAYLESLLRAADWAASAEPSKVLTGSGQEVDA